MKKTVKVLAIIALVAIIGFSMVTCGDDDDPPGNPSTAKYEGKDIAGNTYTLTITEKAKRAAYAGAKGDSYKLVIKMKDGTENVSRGTIKETQKDGTFTLQPSYKGSGTFSVVISEEKISSVTGAVAVESEGGKVKSITASTFKTIYLRTLFWNNDYIKSHGYSWETGPYVKISDFIDEDIIGKKYKVTVSGTVDKDLIHLRISFVLTKNGIWSGHMGNTDGSTAIKAGNFDCTGIVDVKYPTDIDQDTLDGTEEPFAQLVVEIYSDYNGDIVDNGTIPKNIPEGTIIATIRNFNMKIEEYEDE